MYRCADASVHSPLLAADVASVLACPHGNVDEPCMTMAFAAGRRIRGYYGAFSSV